MTESSADVISAENFVLLTAMIDKGISCCFIDHTGFIDFVDTVSSCKVLPLPKIRKTLIKLEVSHSFTGDVINRDI